MCRTQEDRIFRRFAQACSSLEVLRFRTSHSALRRTISTGIKCASQFGRLFELALSVLPHLQALHHQKCASWTGTAGVEGLHGLRSQVTGAPEEPLQLAVGAYGFSVKEVGPSDPTATFDAQDHREPRAVRRWCGA